MLDVADLNAFYGDSHILFNVSLKIPPGGRVAMLGRNGAGKSTFLKSITGSGPTTRGRMSWDGKDLSGMATHERARAGIGFVPEDRRILGSLTVFENLRMAWSSTPPSRRAASPDDVLRQYPMLVPIKDRLGGFLSGGQQQLLALARAAINMPTLLLLDEPTEGLAPVIVEGLVEDVLRICGDGRCSLLLCEQSVWFSRQCTTYVNILDSGRVVFSGTWAEFDANAAIRDKHLSVA